MSGDHMNPSAGGRRRDMKKIQLLRDDLANPNSGVSS